MGSGAAPSGLIAALVVAAALAGTAPAVAGCATDRIDVRLTTGGSARFTVELATDPASRARGLMHRPSLPMAAGMLFVYEVPGPASFWMRNTLIPLDMVFADATGTVRHVHENAIPHDETAIDGGDGVLAVLEINGGLARQLGITAGAILRHPAFADGPAAWPCK